MPPCDQNYTVKQGDCCDSISANKNVSTEAKAFLTECLTTLTILSTSQISAADGEQWACDNLVEGTISHTHSHFFHSAPPKLASLIVLQVLCLAMAGYNCTSVYPVQPDDDCAKIADAAQIDFTTLRANNPNIDEGCTNIYPGEVCISFFLSHASCKNYSDVPL